MANAIEIDGLSVCFMERGRRVDALKGLNLVVKEGTVYGFLGPNGAGKTTTMHVLLGFLGFEEGMARIFGRDVRDAIARSRIGYLPENPQSYPFLTGRELLMMSGRLFHLRGHVLKMRVAALLEEVSLSEVADRRIATYSRGMMQRIGLAQSLINDPDLVILDEPTGGMDPLGRMDIRRIIVGLREQGKTVFFSSHELSEVELVCDQVAILVKGRVAVSDKAEALASSGGSLEQYFLKVVRGAGGAP